MSSCIYDRVFIVPPANDSFGRGPNRYNPAPKKSRLSKISIAWWLVPSVVVYMAVSALVFG
jgi:hypothetical protein